MNNCSLFLIILLVGYVTLTEIGRDCMTPHGVEGVCKLSSECDAPPFTDEATKELIFCSDDRETPVICCANDVENVAEIESEKEIEIRETALKFLQLCAQINQPEDPAAISLRDQLYFAEDVTLPKCKLTDISEIIGSVREKKQDRFWKIFQEEPLPEDSFDSLESLKNESFNRPGCGSAVPLPKVFGSINGFLYSVYFLNWTTEYLIDHGYTIHVFSMYYDAVVKFKYWNVSFCGSIAFDDVLISHVVENTSSFKENLAIEVRARYTAAIGEKTQDKVEWRCSGVLIKPKWVISAAHCVQHYSSGIVVRLGEVDISKGRSHNTYFSIETEVVQSFINPGYTPPAKYHDMSLLELVHDIPFLNLNINPICLPWNDVGKYHVGEKLVFSGFGAENYGGSEVGQLKVIPVTVFSPTYCGNGYSSITTFEQHFPDGMTHENVFCAGNEHQPDACQGDSGAPIAYELNGKYTLAATISLGIGCGDINYPGVSVPINNKNYLTWIDRVI